MGPKGVLCGGTGSGEANRLVCGTPSGPLSLGMTARSIYRLAQNVRATRPLLTHPKHQEIKVGLLTSIQRQDLQFPGQQ